jgi:hypothetical protein
MESVSLKEHIEKILAEKDKAVNIALAAAKEAVQVAEVNAEKWRANANEWRSAMTDRERTFLARGEFEAYKTAVEKALAVEKERGDKDDGKHTGVNQGWLMASGIVAFAILVVGFLVKFI